MKHVTLKNISVMLLAAIALSACTFKTQGRGFAGPSEQEVNPAAGVRDFVQIFEGLLTGLGIARGPMNNSFDAVHQTLPQDNNDIPGAANLQAVLRLTEIACGQAMTREENLAMDSDQRVLYRNINTFAFPAGENLENVITTLTKTFWRAPANETQRQILRDMVRDVNAVASATAKQGWLSLCVTVASNLEI